MKSKREPKRRHAQEEINLDRKQYFEELHIALTREGFTSQPNTGSDCPESSAAHPTRWIHGRKRLPAAAGRRSYRFLTSAVRCGYPCAVLQSSFYHVLIIC